jgi:protein-tyrosine-phosphatase
LLGGQQNRKSDVDIAIEFDKSKRKTLLDLVRLVSMNKPKMVTQEMANQVDLIVTMGCGASDLCPGPFFKGTVDWALEDPKGKSIDTVREIRDEIERRVKESILVEK